MALDHQEGLGTEEHSGAVQEPPIGLPALERGRQLDFVSTRGGQTFSKSTEIRNSVAFRAFFSVFFHPFCPWWQNRFPSSFSNVLTDWEANSG